MLNNSVRSCIITTYCVSDRQTYSGDEKNAGGKARRDIISILSEEMPVLEVAPTKSIDFGGARRSVSMHICCAKVWKTSLEKLVSEDTIVVQFPLTCHSIFAPRILAAFRKRGIRLIVLIHDLELMRHFRNESKGKIHRLRIAYEETHLLKQADVIVAHNDSMKAWLKTELGIPSSRIVSLGLFDYLSSEARGDFIHFNNNRYPLGPVVIAGNLSVYKAGYISGLPDDVPFALYGVNLDFELPANVRYMGSFSPDDGPNLLEGSFGLVWDGDSVLTCSGVYGEYLRYNNPHKTSLYIAAGLPVIIWDQAALAPYIREKGLGITVSSLSNLSEAVHSISEQEYGRLLKNVAREAVRLRSGANTKGAIKKALDCIST